MAMRCGDDFGTRCDWLWPDQPQFWCVRCLEARLIMEWRAEADAIDRRVDGRHDRAGILESNHAFAYRRCADALETHLRDCAASGMKRDSGGSIGAS